MMPNNPMSSGAVANSDESEAINGGVIDTRAQGATGSAHASANRSHASGIGSKIKTHAISSVGVSDEAATPAQPLRHVSATSVEASFGSMYASAVGGAASSGGHSTTTAMSAHTINNYHYYDSIERKEDKSTVDATLSTANTTASGHVRRLVFAADPHVASGNMHAVGGDATDVVMDSSAPAENLQIIGNWMPYFLGSSQPVSASARVAAATSSVETSNSIGIPSANNHTLPEVISENQTAGLSRRQDHSHANATTRELPHGVGSRAAAEMLALRRGAQTRLAAFRLKAAFALGLSGLGLFATGGLGGLAAGAALGIGVPVVVEKASTCCRKDMKRN